MHKKSFKFRLYPTKTQQTILNNIIFQCRFLYNHFLEERKNAWETEKKSLSLYDQIKTLPKLKRKNNALNSVYSQSLQNVAVRIDLAFKSFFRRIKQGDKPGYPRFKGKDRYNSFVYPQSGFTVKENYICLAKAGRIKSIIHRPIEGQIKTCCIRRTNTGKWFVVFSCEVEKQLLPKSVERVGIDVGLSSFATLSNEEKIENPRFFRKSEKKLAKAQRKLSKQIKGTPERKKAKKVVAHVYEKTANQRQDFAHKQSRIIVNKFGVIVVEDLGINKMIHNHCLAKSIADVAWGQFLQYIKYKAEEAGRKYIAVNPAYTSQNCSFCGHRQKLSLSDRNYFCPCCNHSLDRDVNASLNILSLGLQTLGLVPRSPGIYSRE